MKIIAWCAFLLTMGAVAQAQPLVMITDFDPFGGASVNTSIAVAARVQRQLKARGIESKICRLPVVYESGALAAEACFEAMPVKPQLVLSLGEGDCTLRLETAARNLDSAPGVADNAGAIRTDEIIQPGAPEVLPFAGFVGDMYCSLPQAKRRAIEVSASAGGFVCNDVAERLGGYLLQKQVLFSFMHVPSHSCSRAPSPVAVGDAIAAMVKGLPQLQGYDELSYARLSPELPTSVEQATRVLAQLGESPRPATACEREFTKRLERRLEDSPADHSITY